MAELEVSIPYKSQVIAVARFITLLTFPYWGVMAPIQVLFSLVGLIFLPFMLSNLRFEYLLGLVYAASGVAWNAGLIYLGIRAVLITGDRSISLNETGVSFPLNFILGLQMKRHRSWKELLDISVDRVGRTIKFSFVNGASALVKLDKLSQQEQFLLGVKVFSKSESVQEDISAMLEQYEAKRGIAGPSFTHLWEEQMNRHYSSTAFVPLPQGAALQSGRIKVIGPIAFGGLSAVYLAQHKSADTVVLKELVTDDVSNDEMLQKSREMFAREAAILINLKHEKIAKVLDHFTENGRSYLVLEHIQGENLRNIVKQSGKRSEKETIEWGMQICEILHYIHKQEPPIIHRDVTPDNLVLSKGKEVILIDFGAANTFLGTATGTLVGKQAYISPEQFKGKPVVQSDIYSLGATLFFFITGSDPEPLSSSRPSEKSVEISKELDDIIADCTEFEQSKRPANAEELSHRLSNVYLKYLGQSEETK